MLRKCFLFFILSLTLASCKKDSDSTVEPIDYLEKWHGNYEGISHQYTTYPQGSTMVTTHWYKDVVVDVKDGDLDSSLRFDFTYDNTVFESMNNIKFDANYSHNSQWGFGSGYGSLSIQFSSDSVLSYNLFQKCGIPCSSGEDFLAIKK